ncbi:MAG: CocE/NonD family hydrolase [Gammaproteobacteria bacterium]
MRIADSALERIEEIENVFIPLADGRRIAARLWLPKDAEHEPVPAILEYIPYRKRDFMRSRDEPIHRYYAANGYAAVRADVRGTGDSDGILTDEYAPGEQHDACEIIAWIAAQPWCSGAVGMTGISWGGFNALQVAALRPPALKAIITLCASDDRYADDAHYMGGCLLNENMQWGSILMLNAALPPDPQIVGERWREMWLERINAVEAFPALWMRHQTRDDFWRQGSVCENYAAIECPVYAIGGWADGYTNAVPRLVANLKSPCKGLIGPWAHNFPHDAAPGPSIGFLQEALRWWDQWLKGFDTGIMDEPRYRVWMQESVTPQPQYHEWPGRWVAEPVWPSPTTNATTLYLNTGHLTETPERPVELSFSSPQTTGARSGEWCGFGSDGDMPRDQRPDDGGSLVFEGDPLEERIELLGAPVLELELRADRPLALLCARLGDVAPDGSVLRVSYGLLNLAHRSGHETPGPLTPGEWVQVRLQLNDLAHAFPSGHRLRISLSTSYWPIAWPSPEPVVIGIRTGTSCLTLPVRTPRDDDAKLPRFDDPEAAPGSMHKKLMNLPLLRTLAVDLATNEMVYTLKSDGGEFDGASLARLDAIGLDIGYTLMKRYRIIETDPLSAQTELQQSALMRRGDWKIRLTCSTRLSSTEQFFQFTGDLEAFEGDRAVAHRQWTLSIPRNGI